MLHFLESTDKERIAEVSKLINDATSAMKKNEKEVKQKIFSLNAAKTRDAADERSRVKADKL